jgi:hypothetical protein
LVKARRLAGAITDEVVALHYRDTPPPASVQHEWLEWVGHGPSFRGDERRLDDRHRPFMPEWQLRAIEPPLGQFASTPAVDPQPPFASGRYWAS